VLRASRAGVATLFLGLIVTLPLIGHAIWQALVDTHI